MKHNVGGVDRVVRVLVGLAIIGLGIGYGTWWGIVGILPLFTGIVTWCPGYLPFGISTCKKDAGTSS